MTVFDFSNYKEFLRHQIDTTQVRRGYHTRLAEAAGCSRSFLSQALSGDIDLTRDHAAGLCRFWNFQNLELEYFLSLVDLSRARTRTLQEHLTERLHKLRQDQNSLTTRVGRPKLVDERVESVYYSSWTLAAVHMLLTISKFRNAQDIADRLKLDLATVERVLNKLSDIGVIQYSETSWRPLSTDMNLAETSALSATNHSNWRNKAIANLQDRKPDSVYYSSVFTLSQKDADKLRGLVKAFIMESRQMIVASPAQNLFCMNIDLFEI